MEGDSSL